MPASRERRRLILVSHRSPHQSGGGAARWRALARFLPREGWDVDVVTSRQRASSAEFAAEGSRQAHVARRAQIMSRARALAGPVFAAVGLRPLPLSTLWLLRGTLELRRALRAAPADAVLATAPPMVGLLVGRLGTLGSRVPLVIEMRDLWAGNPAYDAGGPLLGAVERRVMRGAKAVIVCTPEAALDVARRHRELAQRVHVIPNGFEPALLEYRPAPAATPPTPPLTILHSGTLVAARPLAPLLEVLAREPYRSSFRLVLHGYVVPEIIADVDAHRDAVDVQILPPSDWEDAVRRIAHADVALITQSRAAGDDTAVASKVYEYLALGRPVLCLTHGGATEALLRRLGADRFTADLDDRRAIAAALDALLANSTPAPLPVEALEPYSRRRHATELAALLELDSRVSMVDAGLKEQVRDFWDAEPCGDMHATAEPGTPEYFAAIERQRDAAEPYISDYADFSGARGKTLLEIGVGLGTDHIRFARAGAITTGIDLTQQSIELVGRRFANEGLEGTLVQGDAENLPFPDGTFERVYSWGVLHHTPDTERAVREAIRVLKPAGEICVMLYGRHSWVAWALWAKYALLRGRPWRSINSVLGEHMESRGTKGYTPRELRHMFAGLDDLRVEPVATVYDRNYAGSLVSLTGDRFGWFIVVRGRQPRVA